MKRLIQNLRVEASRLLEFLACHGPADVGEGSKAITERVED